MNRANRPVQSIERAMLLLEILRAQGGSARLGELAARAGLSKSTVHGLLDTLLDLGYVSRAGMDYTLGVRLGLLAQAAQDEKQRLRQAFLPALQAFAEISGENCFLAVASGTQAYLTLEAVDGNGRPLLLAHDEKRDALPTSAIGKVLLAGDRQLARRLCRRQAVSPALAEELARVNDQGFALDLGACEQSLHCVALPLRLRGKVVAALGAGGPAQRLPAALMQRMARRAMNALFDLVKY